MNQAKYIGMDVHQATISVAVMDSVGKLILESVLETKAARIQPKQLQPGFPLEAADFLLERKWGAVLRRSLAQKIDACLTASVHS